MNVDRRQILSLAAGLAGAGWRHGQAEPPASPEMLRIGDAELEVSFSGAPFDLTKPGLLAWVSGSATAVANYLGHFPVRRACLQVVCREGRRGVTSGRTWGKGGARTRIIAGQHATVAELNNDWMLPHEFVHYGFPDMPEDHSWIEEGLSTYIEPIARVNAGTQYAARAWFEMVRDMLQGLPKEGGEGLDHTHTWGRTYWGVAIFCLVADVTIRKNTKNARGLRDAMRGIVRAGGSIEVDWPIERALEIGDKAGDGKTLMSLYGQMRDKPEPLDLAGLWRELGVSRRGETVVFDDTAPLAAIRKSILS